MGIKLQDIILSLSRDVDEAYSRLKREGIGVTIPEVEITMNLEVELEGREEPVEKPTARRRTATSSLRKFVIDGKILRERGLSFRSLKSTPQAKENSNFTIKIVFIPSEEE